jgi:integrase
LCEPTGARVSEIIAARRVDLECERGQALHLHGKGRKERVVPLSKQTANLLRESGCHGLGLSPSNRSSQTT